MNGVRCSADAMEMKKSDFSTSNAFGIWNLDYANASLAMALKPPYFVHREWRHRPVGFRTYVESNDYIKPNRIVNISPFRAQFLQL